MYRAITIQSKDVVDLLLRGETYRCDIHLYGQFISREHAC